MTGILRNSLDIARRDLLDLSARNRLLNTPRHRSRSKSIEIVEELSEQVFRILARDGRAMSFLPAPEARQLELLENDGGETPLRSGAEQQPVPDGSPLLLQPEDAGPDVLSESRTDARLQTKLTSEQLQKRLLSIYYDARTFEEEQGVSILYLALGFLKWFEAPSSDKVRYAPLLLLPVDLERQTANSRFRIRCRDEDITTNLSLQAKLKAEFGIELPNVPDSDDLSPDVYFEAVEKAISVHPRWEVDRNGMVLGFFSFAKFLMYRDLDPDNWPEGDGLDQHPLILGLLREGFGHDPPLCGDDDPIDELIAPPDMIHVVDADSSQALVIEEVRRGRHLVIQGPPGTGKSQTITNLIATAVKQGKRVLFVAEKMAALDVVKSRLDAIGLGELCLELHSHKANKKGVLADLQRTLNLRRPRSERFEKQAEQLQAVRDRLNRHAGIMHRPLEPAGLTPYQIIGELVRLRAEGVQPADFALADPLSWTRTDYQQKAEILQDVLVHLREVGNPAAHPMRGVRLEVPLLPSDFQRLKAKLPKLAESLRQLIQSTQQLADLLKLQPASSAVGPSAAQKLAQLARKLVTAPRMDRQSIGHGAWEKERTAIAQLVEAGQAYAQCQSDLSGVVADVAWNTDLAETRRNLAAYGRSWWRWLNGRYRRAQATLRGILNDPPPKALADRLRIVDTLIRGQRARATLDSDAAALGRAAFGELWQGVESDWPALAAILEWERECREEKLPRNFRQVMAGLEDPERARALLQEIVTHLKPAFQAMQSIIEDTRLDLRAAFGADDLREVAFRELLDRLERWLEDPEAISKWIAYNIRRKRLHDAGLDDLSDHLHGGLVTALDALDASSWCTAKS